MQPNTDLAWLDSKLADTAPALVGTALILVMILGPCFWLMWRMFRRTTEVIDRWFDRHEKAESEQFKMVYDNTLAVQSNTEATNRLVDRISHREVRAMSVEYGIPEGDFKFEYMVSADFLAKFAADQRDWGHQNLGLVPLHEKGIKGEGVTVAILDTGVDKSHPDLAGQLVAIEKDYTGSPVGPADRQSHGTHVGGIVGSAENNVGMIGSAPKSKLMRVKVLSDGGSGASTWIAAGIRFAADSGADIISMSLGGPSPDSATRGAIQYAAAKGCWIVAAAGNEGRNTVNYPGAYEEVLCVAATDKNNNRAGFSSTNSQVDVAAPGVAILSSVPGNKYAAYSGTSMATPYVAGCLALVRGELKRLGLPIPNQLDLIKLVKETSTDLGAPGVDPDTGAGLINTAKLIEKLTAGVQPPKPEPTPDPLPPPAKSVVVKTPELLAAGIKSITVEL